MSQKEDHKQTPEKDIDYAIMNYLSVSKIVIGVVCASHAFYG